LAGVDVQSNYLPFRLLPFVGRFGVGRRVVISLIILKERIDFQGLSIITSVEGRQSASNPPSAEAALVAFILASSSNAPPLPLFPYLSDL